MLKIKDKIFKIFKQKEKMPQREEIKFSIIEQGLRNNWYEEVKDVSTIENDIKFLKSIATSQDFVIHNYIERLEEIVEKKNNLVEKVEE